MSVIGLAMLLLVLLLVFLLARIAAKSNIDQDMERMILDEDDEEDDEVRQENESSDQVGAIFIIDDGYEGRCQNSNIRVDKKIVTEKAIYQVQ